MQRRPEPSEMLTEVMLTPFLIFLADQLSEAEREALDDHHHQSQHQGLNLKGNWQKLVAAITEPMEAHFLPRRPATTFFQQ